MSDTPDLDRAQEAAEATLLAYGMHPDDWPKLRDAITRGYLRQRTEEAELAEAGANKAIKAILLSGIESAGPAELVRNEHVRRAVDLRRQAASAAPQILRRGLYREANKKESQS